MRSSEGRRPTGVRNKIYGYLILFVLFTVALLWIFQTVFLDRFYTVITKARLADAAVALADTEDREKAHEIAEKISLDNDACIRIFKIKGTQATTRLTVDSELGCVIHRLSQRQLNELYATAAEEGEGIWTRFQLREGDFRFAWEMDDGTDYDGTVIDERLVYSLIAGDADGEHVFVLLDVSLEPIDSTVNILRVQLLVLTLILLLVSALLAYVIAKHISEPIVHLNDAARLLPKGTYPEDYRENGYREVAELSETLGEAAGEIGKVDRLQRELIANISHDLRTPLTMIIGYAEVMRDIEGENTPENIQVIINEATRLSSMVGDLVEISRYQGGAESMSPETFSLSDEAHALLEEYRALLTADGYTLTDEITDGILVTADRKRILQVLRNLLDNAVNYSGKSQSITLRIQQCEETARVEVTDRGEGIPEEELENIWQRYYRATGNHERSVVGSGLGLSIVRENLELHGARYGVDSKLGEGSTFWFELPLSLA